MDAGDTMIFRALVRRFGPVKMKTAVIEARRRCASGRAPGTTGHSARK